MGTGRRWAWLSGVLLLALAGVAGARGLQVSPVSFTFAPRDHGQALWLTNTGEQLLHAQVRVYRWTQPDGTDHLDPTRDVVATPPMIEVPAGESQLIRVVRPGTLGTAGAEVAYRLRINELPIRPADDSGVDFVMEYSLPVFLAPAGATGPQLHWSVVQATSGARLRVSNSGNGHARLSAVGVSNATGLMRWVADGLLGYVLPGATMEWDIPAQAAAALAAGGRLQASINGREVDAIALADTPG